MGEDPDRAEASRELRYRSLPLVDDWPRSIIAPAGVLGTCVLVALGFGLYFAAFSLLFLLVALGRYFLPVRYELTPRGIRTRFLWFTRERPWSFFRNYYTHDVGVHLTPLAVPGALDAFRGQFLRFSGNRNEVLSYIAGHVDRAQA